MPWQYCAWTPEGSHFLLSLAHSYRWRMDDIATGRYNPTHMRSLARHLIFSTALLLFAASAPRAQSAAGGAEPTTVILVRHAEKAAAPADDPPLTKAGEARAKALATIARDAGVTAIITTQFARTRATARPAADALHITPEVVSAGGAQHVQDVARAIGSHTGGVVLVVGHSNTIPAIIAALGAPQPPPICDSEYDDLYVVTIPANGSAHVIRARYGEPSPVSAACGSMMR
jgi:broad specificity phosphatase PhoE